MTDEVGQSSRFNLDDDGESPDVAPVTGKVDNNDDMMNTGNDQRTDQDQKTDDQETTDQNGKSIIILLCNKFLW